MTNKEWLEYLANNAPDELAAWFDAERTESPTSETMRHIGQVIENTIKRGVYGDTEPQDADSRDKIEADVRKIAEAYNMDTQRHGTERFEHELYYSIIHLLDRQAAITERKLDAEFEAACNSCAIKIDLREEVDKLTADLEAAYAKNRSLRQHISQMQNGRNEWHVKAVRLEKQLEVTNKRCEEYRSKFGKCLDYADAIHALMDDEGLA